MLPGKPCSFTANRRFLDHLLKGPLPLFRHQSFYSTVDLSFQDQASIQDESLIQNQFSREAAHSFSACRLFTLEKNSAQRKLCTHREQNFLYCHAEQVFVLTIRS
jgi:hypothetical protein